MSETELDLVEFTGFNPKGDAIEKIGGALEKVEWAKTTLKMAEAALVQEVQASRSVLSLADISRVLGVSPQRVHQMAGKKSQPKKRK